MLIIIYTNHDAALKISKQITLFIIFTDRLNLRLIRVFEYIQRFRIIIKHKFDKEHTVSDALFRLQSSIIDDTLSSQKKELNALMILDISAINFTITFIEMNLDFREKLKDEYKQDSQ